MRNRLLWLLILLFVLPVSGCFFATTPGKTQYIYDQFGLNFVTNKKIYLAHNIWYKDPMNISCQNYQQGKILPFGTEVEFVAAVYGDDYLIFKTVKDGKEYKIFNTPGLSQLSNEEFFHQVFTTDNPDKKAAKLSKDVVANLKQGIIEIGMTRKDVLLALGPPPLNMSPKGTKTTWTYFLNDRLKTTHIVFKNDKVSYIFEN